MTERDTKTDSIIKDDFRFHTLLMGKAGVSDTSDTVEHSADPLAIRELISSQFIPFCQRLHEPNLPHDSRYRVLDDVVEKTGLPIRAIVPHIDQEDAKFPLLVWYHPGGFMAGNIDLDDNRLRILAVEFQIVVVSVEYRLAPENPFPDAVNDAYAGLKWVITTSERLHSALEQGFIIAGCSAGANLAAVLAHRARDDVFFANHPLTGQMLQMPFTVHPDAYPAEFKDELCSALAEGDSEMTNGLSRLSVDGIYANLKISNPLDPEVSPLLYSSHAGLPPAHIQVAGLDPLRDEGILYEKVLKRAGVNTRLDIYPDVPHGFNLLFPTLSSSARCENDSKTGLRWLLGGAK